MGKIKKIAVVNDNSIAEETVNDNLPKNKLKLNEAETKIIEEATGIIAKILFGKIAEGHNVVGLEGDFVEKDTDNFIVFRFYGRNKNLKG